MSAIIDFDQVNRAALAVPPALLARWLPDGKWHGAEYVAGALRRSRQPPPGVPAGWDAADALAQRMTEAQAAELLARALPVDGQGSAASATKPNARGPVIDLLADAELWHDPERIAFATVPLDGHPENHELGSNFLR